MYKYLLVLLLALISKSIYASQAFIVNCNYCNDTAKLGTISQLIHSGFSSGEYRFVVVDMGFAKFTEFDVTIPQEDNSAPPQNNPVFGVPIEGTIIQKISRSNKSSLESLLDDAKNKYDEAYRQFGDEFITLPDDSPYRSAYDALTYPSDFNDYITSYANNELNVVVSLLKQGQAAVEQLAASLQVGVSALVSASVSLQRNVTGKIKFPDGSYIIITIKLRQDISEGIELKLEVSTEAYSSDGKLLPKNNRELSNYSALGGSFNAPAFSDYLNSKNIQVFLGTGSGGGSCETEWSCDASGKVCTLMVITATCD